MIAVSRSIFLGEPGDDTILVEHQYYESTKSVPVRHSGIWHPVKSVGRTVVEGEQVGVIRDYSGAVVDKVTATASGFAVYGLAGPPVREGESVMSIAIPTEAFD